MGLKVKAVDSWASSQHTTERALACKKISQPGKYQKPGWTGKNAVVLFQLCRSIKGNARGSLPRIWFESSDAALSVNHPMLCVFAPSPWGIFFHSIAKKPASAGALSWIQSEVRMQRNPLSNTPRQRTCSSMHVALPVVVFSSCCTQKHSWPVWLTTHVKRRTSWK